MKLKEYKSITERRKFLEKEIQGSLGNIGHFSLDEKVASTRNCENMIGITQVPLGVAGPLKITTYNLQPTTYYIPLATTEGALVASINRGCKAISESGGASVLEEFVGTTRGPVFKTSGIKESMKFKNWLESNINDLKKIAEATSSHLELIKLGTRIIGKYVYVRFYFNTHEAMGMNMVTIATTAIYQYIESKTGIKCLSVAGNFDIDKKPAWLNAISGRGKRVWAEATIKREVLESILKTTADNIYNVWLGKCMLGSALSGSLGFNAHFANSLTALFIATGQDVAHVVEGSMGITTTEVIDRDLYISIYIPSLMVGVVGGGTNLSTQKEALSLLGIKGEKGDSSKLAEIIGVTVLAGELSLLASLSEGTLASAHTQLARGKLLKELKRLK